MSQVRKTFRAIDVGDGSDGRWAAHLRTLFPQAEGWLTDDGRTAEGALRARKLFEEHMPELVPLLDRLAEQVDRPAAETFLTMAALRPFFSGCTQTGSNGRLLRNYDFPPDECEATIVRSRFLRPVIGMQEVGWGLLDGMNDAGLAVSLTFGGRSLAGPGFAVNVHQHLPVSEEDERTTRTQQRLAAIRASGGDVSAMLRPPLYESRFDDGFGTLYTADYQPKQRRVTYHWPRETWEQSFDRYTAGSRSITLVDHR